MIIKPSRLSISPSLFLRRAWEKKPSTQERKRAHRDLVSWSAVGNTLSCYLWVASSCWRRVAFGWSSACDAQAAARELNQQATAALADTLTNLHNLSERVARQEQLPFYGSALVSSLSQGMRLHRNKLETIRVISFSNIILKLRRLAWRFLRMTQGWRPDEA